MAGLLIYTALIFSVIGKILDCCWTGIIDLACVRCEGTPGKIWKEGRRGADFFKLG